MAKLKSIFTNDFNTCFLSGACSWVEDHHIFFGKNRKNSDKHGMIIPVDHYIHNESPYGIHHNEALNLQVKQFAQREFEKSHTREEFMLIFGENFLFTEEDGHEINLRACGVPECYLTVV